jgi:hypothetical protein
LTDDDGLRAPPALPSPHTVRRDAPVSRGLNEHELRRLMRWQRRMVGTFVGTWVAFLLVIAADLVLHPSREVVQLALVPVFGLVVAGAALQFSVRCPACGYRLGRQARLIVPERCRACGVSLRKPQGLV